MTTQDLTCQIQLHINDVPTFNPCLIFPDSYKIDNSTKTCQLENFTCTELDKNLDWKCTSIFEKTDNSTFYRKLAMCNPFYKTHQEISPKMKLLDERNDNLISSNLLSSSGCLDFHSCLVQDNLKTENHQHCCCLSNNCNESNITFTETYKDSFTIYQDYNDTTISENTDENNKNIRKLAAHPVLLSVSFLILGLILGRLFLVIEQKCCKKRQNKSNSISEDQITTILSSGANTPKSVRVGESENQPICSAVINIDNSNSRRILFDDDLESLESGDHHLGSHLVTPIDVASQNVDSNTPLHQIVEDSVLPIITPLIPSPEPDNNLVENLIIPSQFIDNSRFTNSTYLTENSELTSRLLNSNTMNSQKDLKSNDGKLDENSNHNRRHVSPLLGFRNDLDFMDVLAEMNRFQGMDLQNNAAQQRNDVADNSLREGETEFMLDSD